jgi:transcription elongation factor S-II
MTDIREKSRSLLSSTLSSLSSQEDAATEQARKIEEAIYAKYQGDTGNEYRDELRQLSLNLKHNTELGTQVASGTITAESLVNMTSEVSRNGVASNYISDVE